MNECKRNKDENEIGSKNCTALVFVVRSQYKLTLLPPYSIDLRKLWGTLTKSYGNCNNYTNVYRNIQISHCEEMSVLQA